MAAACAALFFVPGSRHRGSWWLAGLSAGGTAVALGLSRALRLPGLSDSLQDTFTLHWTRLEIAGPWSALARLNLQYRVQWLQNEALAPMLLFLLAVGTTGFAATVAHPLVVELDRLYVPVWLIPVIGLPLAATRFSAARFAPVVPPAAPSAARAVSSPAAPPSP